MKKCKVWFTDETMHKEIKEYCIGNNEYYGLGELPDITPNEELELKRSNPPFVLCWRVCSR